MNRFDEVYEIRRLKLEETDRLMRYIAEDWRAGHIMSVNKELFLHEFYTAEDEWLNIVAAFRKDNGVIDGMLGFIPASKEEKPDLWASMWKIRSGSMMFLGNELMQRLIAMIPHRYFTGIGSDPSTTGQIVKRTLKDYVGRMKHWYILNENADYKLALIREKKSSGYRQSDIKITRVQSREEVERCFDPGRPEASAVYKDLWYIVRRYFDYPIHRYELYLLGGDKAEALLATREVEAKGAKVLRIMDLMGDRSKIAELGPFLRGLLTEKNCEYVDFYENGFAVEDLKAAGFIERTVGDVNVIPNHFSPFEQENTEIYFHAQSPDLVFCKADGDQDRPN